MLFGTNEEKVIKKNQGVHLCLNQGAKSTEFAPWMDPESQVLKSSAKENYCLEDKVKSSKARHKRMASMGLHGHPAVKTAALVLCNLAR